MFSSSESSNLERQPDPGGGAFGGELAELLRRHVAQLLASGRSGIYHTVLLNVESVLVATATKHCNGNNTESAKALGITRTTFRAKVRTINVCASHKPPGPEPSCR